MPDWSWTWAPADECDWGFIFIFSILTVPPFPNTFIHQLEKKKTPTHSHVPIPDLARAFHTVKVLTVKSAKKQQPPHVFFLNLKADILYIAFIRDQALFLCTYWQVTFWWVQPRRASPSPQQPVGNVAEDTQPSCPQPVLLLCVDDGPLRTGELRARKGWAVGGAVAFAYVHVSVIMVELLLQYQEL